jgi:hypothetical protein
MLGDWAIVIGSVSEEQLFDVGHGFRRHFPPIAFIIWRFALFPDT